MTLGASLRISNIDVVRSRFEQWRRIRQGRARIPDELWAAAIEVARRDGISRTAAALHLDGTKLRGRMATADAASTQAMGPRFVELMSSGASRRLECTIELEGGNGKMRVHCQGMSAAEVAELSQALWGVAA